MFIKKIRIAITLVFFCIISYSHCCVISRSNVATKKLYNDAQRNVILLFHFSMEIIFISNRSNASR